MNGDGAAARALFERLRAAGVRIEVYDSRLRWSAPRGLVTEELKAEMSAAKTELIAMVRADEVPALPLSAAQRRLVVLDELRPGRADFNVPVVARVQGALDRRAISRALDALADRHEILRSSFTLEDGDGIQRVAASMRVPLSVRDSPTLKAALLAVEEEVQRPFDLGKPPMLRAAVYRIARDDNIVVLTFHHVVCDETSQWIALRELIALYQEYAGGPSAGLPPPRQYAEYVAWEHRRAATTIPGRDLLEYWRAQLAGLRQPVSARQQPTDARANAAPVHADEIPVGRLEALACAERTSLLTVVLALFAIALAEPLGRSDIVVAVPCDDRRRTEFEGTIGHFINTLLINPALGGCGTLREAVRAVRAVMLGALAHAEMPYERVVESVAPGARGGELYDAWLVVRQPPLNLSVPGVEFKAVDIGAAITRHRLKLDLVRGQDGLAGTLTGLLDGWGSSVVDKLATCVAALLARGGEMVDAPIAVLLKATAADVESHVQRCRAASDDEARRRLRAARRRV